MDIRNSSGQTWVTASGEAQINPDNGSPITRNGPADIFLPNGVQLNGSNLLMEGRFLGPNAEEAAGSWSIDLSQANDLTIGMATGAAGVFRAGQ